MEIEATYIAKDGMRFKDPLECESYEKKLGTLKGSVGELVNELEKKDQKWYIFGIIIIGGGKNLVMTRYTVCCDDALESFVNISDLREKQRYLYCTVGSLVESLKEYDKDLPCQYLILMSPVLDFKGTLSSIANYNKDAWK